MRSESVGRVVEFDADSISAAAWTLERDGNTVALRNGIAVLVADAFTTRTDPPRIEIG